MWQMSHKRKILLGSASNIVRVLLSALVALVLPPFLVHRMSPAEYSAWVLILQVSAYVSLLDFGLQTAIGKFVAEYDAVGDLRSASSVLSSSFALLCVAALLGATLIATVSWQVPTLFHQMPTALFGDVRKGLLAVGLSLTFALPFNAFLAVFTGLQNYLFPTALSTISKLASSAALVVLLLMGGSLVQLALLIATFNVITGISQYLGWRALARDRVKFALNFVDRAIVVRLTKYGSVLSIWTLAGLFISGLDTVIVGHFDYRNTGFYAIATSVTNFMLLIVSSSLSPLLPAISSLQSSRTPQQIGNITIKSTRYCALMLCIMGLPIFFGAYPLLSMWVGRDYALRSARFLEYLVLGNGIRQLGYPYAIAVVATGKQHLATIAGVAEAAVNFGLSILLAQKIGALGVAIGTLTGAFVSVAMHVLLSMHFTQSTIQMSRRRFLWDGLLRPLSCTIPSLVLIFFWKEFTMFPASPAIVILWIICTIGIVWFIGLKEEEHRYIINGLARLPANG
jgi:O-antigen/teichoic acid export membrane protein